MSRQYRSPAQWLELLEAFAQSRQTQTSFCAKHGLTPSYFSKRRREILRTGMSCADSGFIQAQPPVVPSTSSACNNNAPDQWLIVRYQCTELQLPLSIEPRWLASLVKD